MSLHSSAVFKNSCLKVPVDPSNKLPITEYERLSQKDATIRKHKRNSFDSILTEDTILKEDMPVTYLQEFYNSIPDYRELTHLSNQEFYSKLDDLKKKKRQLLRRDDNKHYEDFGTNVASPYDCYYNNPDATYNATKCKKSEINYAIQKNYEHANDNEKNELSRNRNDAADPFVVSPSPFENKYFNMDNTPDIRVEDTEMKITTETTNLVKEKRNNSACSITWDDSVKYKEDYGRTNDFMAPHKNKEIISPKRSSFKSLSVPTSPIKVRSSSSEKNLTVPKPFKMTLRDEDEMTVKQLQKCSKSLSDDLIINDNETKSFKANPVPIESRILLYDKILQDQEMRRTVTKINSMAELQSKMKPFSFTEKDECRPKFCSKRFSSSQPHLNILTSPKKEKHFRAKPVPRNLFSNYIYDKMREDDFYRALNRRIRAEELLRASSLPPSMAARETIAKRSVNSTPCCYRTSNETTSSGSGSSASQKRNKKTKKTKKTVGASKIYEKELDNLHDNFISTSPHPFHFKTANRIGRRAALKKIYSSQSVPSDSLTATSGATNRPQSAFEVRSVNRSNLAAVLRIESAKKKIDEDVKRKMDEEKFKTDLKWRDNVLRKKPAWQTLKYSQDEDIAIRLQTRRDEERLRREQFLHEMELMYGRVQQQPLLFERYYPSCSRKSRKEIMRHIEDDLNSLTSKIKSRNSSALKIHSHSLPARKISLNESSKSYKQHLDSYATGKSIEQINASDSDEVPESIYGDLNDQ